MCREKINKGLRGMHFVLVSIVSIIDSIVYNESQCDGVSVASWHMTRILPQAASYVP